MQNKFLFFVTKLVFPFLVLSFPFSSIANDTMASTSGNELLLEKSSEIRMKSEFLEISPKKVEVRYVFFNETSQDITSIVAFPLAEHWGVYLSSMEAGGGEYQFPDFYVSFNQKKINFKTKSKATFEKLDITKKLQSLGVPTDRFLKPDQLPKNALKKLIKRGWYSTDNLDAELGPMYTIKKTHYWEQNFPAQKELQSIHGYSPELGLDSIGSLKFTGKWKNFFLSNPDDTYSGLGGYCRNDLTDTSCAKLARTFKEEGFVVGTFGASYFKYIISTGSNWKNGIEDFHLTITGAAIIFVEIDGQVDFDIGSYRFNKKNFFPKKELLVEFVGESLPAKLPKMIRLQKAVDGPANCRQAPKGSIIVSIPNQEKVVVRERKDDWYKVEYKNYECWTNRQNLTFLN